MELQTNNILFLTNKTFIEIKEIKLQEAGFLAKEREKLT